MKKIERNNKKRIRAYGIGKNHIKSITVSPTGPMPGIYRGGVRRPNNGAGRSLSGYYIKDRVTLPPSNNKSTVRNLKERLSIIGVPGPHRNIVRDGNKIPPHKMRINKIVKGTRVLKSKRRL